MYGWSKLYCENLIQTFARQQGLEYVILRLGHVYGEGEEKYRKVMPVMIESAINGNDITIYGDGEELRTFIYIDDVAKAIVNSIRLTTSKIINIVGNEAVSINALAKMILRIADADVKVNHIDSDTMNRYLTFDNSKLMNTLLDGVTQLEEGLCKEIDYMKDKMCEHSI